MQRSDDMPIRASTGLLVLAVAIGIGGVVSISGGVSTTEADDDSVQAQVDAAGIEFFERKIRPILLEHCLECHGEDPGSLKGEFDLSHAAGTRAGGESGVAIIPGDPEGSSLFQAVSYANKEFAMPPRGRLSDQQVADIRKWIEIGAPDPRDVELAAPIEAPLDPWRDPAGKGREHWAYVPMADVVPPSVEDSEWCRNDVDRFILAKLEDAEIEPAPEADRRTLARRAYFDLIGLPPSPEEMKIFLADDRPDAWERLIDRLLESPHYGERWGRHWLDVARYADSNGLDENTAFGNAWRYRDWVVRAFNDDLPYDEFTRMQIAGDLLPEPDDRDAAIDNLIATGFLSLGPKVLAEPDKEKMLVDIVDEQVDVLTKAFLAQTVGCARCHDHKFDPILHADYYAMAGILISTRTMENLNTVARVRERPLAPVAEIAVSKAHAEASKKNDAAIAAANAEGSRRLGDAWSNRTADAMLLASELERTPRVFEAEDFADSNLGVNLDNYGSGIGIIHTVATSNRQFVEYDVPAEEGGRWHIMARFASGESRPLRIMVGEDVLAEGFCGEKTGSFEVEAMMWAKTAVDVPPGTSRIRFERPTSFPHLDRLVIVSDLELQAFDAELAEVAVRSGVDEPLLRRWAEALAGESIFDSWRRYAAIAPENWEVETAARTEELQRLYAADATAGDGKLVRSGVTPRETPFVRSMVAGPPPRSLAAVADRWQAASSLVVDSWNRHRATAKGDAAKRLPDPAQEQFRLALLGPTGVLRLGPDVADHYPEELLAQIRELQTEADELTASAPQAIATGIVVEEDEPRDLPIFVRGDHTNKQDEVVPRGYLTVLEGRAVSPEISSEVSGRLELAQWITDPEHPLTSRAIVNRIWAWHFGTGIVATPSNFGLRGERPTHPELLDWLATRFVEHDWSIKDLHRLLMNSSAYRLSGRPDPHAAAADPANDLRWRRTPRRLEAELVRDAILEVGGSLDRTVGGSILRTGNFGYVTNDQSRSNERYGASRRAIYMPVIRNDMYELFATFDYTDPSVSFDRRPSTVVAQQSLFMMNSPMVASQAERLAGSLLEDPGLADDASRIGQAYEICFARPATSVEIERGLRFLGELEPVVGESTRVSWPDADSMGGSGGAEHAEGRIDARHHAWRSFCKVLIASNEFIYVR
jgi:mono/diheme cytochrome c family protein